MRLVALLLSLPRLLLRSALLALAQVWANKGRSILTTIGIVIGVAAVTTVIAALSGLRANVLRDFESIGAGKLFIFPHWPDQGTQRHASWRSIRFTPEQTEGLTEHCPSVECFTRQADRSGIAVEFDKQTTDAVIRGIEPEWHRIENRSVVLGRPFSLIDNEQAQPVCLVTESLRDRLRLDRQCMGQRVLVDGRYYLIVGVVEPPTDFGMFGGGPKEEEILIPFSTYWKTYGGRGWSYIIAVSKSPTVSDEARAEVSFFLRQRRHLKPGESDTFQIEVVQQYIDKFNQLSTMVTLVAGGIVGISLIVGGVGIMNIMLVSVSERTREIGLRKAVGAGAGAILMQFLVEAVVLCLIGGLIGLALGQAFTAALGKILGAKLEHAFIPGWAITLSLGFAAGVGVLFGMFPAVKAARLDPIEALRHE
jgi:putative ABC transport system permease protein